MAGFHTLQTTKSFLKERLIRYNSYNYIWKGDMSNPSEIDGLFPTPSFSYILAETKLRAVKFQRNYPKY